MCPFDIFLVCNYGVLPAWALLVVAPQARVTRRVVHAAWLPLALAGVYFLAFAVNQDSPEGGGFTTLDGVMALFTGPWLVLAGWVHYLAFDLFIGAWEVRDAQRLGIRHAYVVPCLVFTLMLGPLGLAMYLALRAAITGAFSLDESPAASA